MISVADDRRSSAELADVPDDVFDWAVPGELDVVDDRAVAEPDQPFDSGSDLRVVGGDDPVAQAVACQRLTFEARAPRCGRYGCATAGRVKWT